MGGATLTNGSTQLIPFTAEHVKNRELIMKMLAHEDTIIHSDVATQIYRNPTYGGYQTLETVYITHRMTLTAFNFCNTDEDVKMYRTIFRNYYRSPTEYDKEVLDKVTYMRENKCVYYTGKDYNIGDTFHDVPVWDITGTQQLSVVNILQNQRTTEGEPYLYTFIGAFSNS